MCPSQETRWYLPLLICLCVGIGCNTPEASPRDGHLVTTGVSQSDEKPQTDGAVAAVNEPDPNSESNPAEISSEPQVYQPPFPNRVDLFVPPKRGPNALALGRKEGESAVKLLGFSNVNDVRVVLSIDGFVYPVAEGESKSGIEVVSIKPPAVVLQRGRQVWQASLEN